MRWQLLRSIVILLAVAGVTPAQTCVTDTDCETPCTATAVCNGGTCETTPVVCDDSNPCTIDACNIDNGNCTFSDQPNGTSCADGNLCNGDEACHNGSCGSGQPLDCNDGNDCTIDSCAPLAGCQTNPIPGCCTSHGECGDTSACTTNERCVGNQCLSDAVNCDDGNPCTDDSCDPASGCAHTPVPDDTSCGDGNLCNGLETCQGGGCVNPGPPDCDDGNACTTDGCDSLAGCTTQPVPGCCNVDTECADGSACTINERCVQNGCVSDALGCDDSNPCTSDSCDAGSGCVFSPVPNGQSCADATVCNGLETCQGGLCAPGQPLDCDDGNACTNDGCNASSGCTHGGIAGCCNVDGECLDTDACTINHRCVSHVCTSSQRNCNDANACTIDLCDPASGCQNPAVLDGTSCSDAQACDGVETCAAGTCQPGTPPNCDDGNACTTDSCNNASGCQHGAVAGCCNTDAQCADSNLCTTEERCTLSHTCSTLPVNCNDGNQCTADGCTPATGCTHVATPSASCNDGDACTLSDICLGGQCGGTPRDCSDGNLCNGPESCQGSGACSTPASFLVCTPGSRRDTTCGAEWFADVPNNLKGPLVTKQECVEGDPSCDHDTSAGTCSFRFGICFRVNDSRLLRPCTPSNVSVYNLLKPTKDRDFAVTTALENALLAIPGAHLNPVGRRGITIAFSPELSTTRCTAAITIPVQVGSKFKLRGKTTTALGIDSDALALRCRPQN